MGRRFLREEDGFTLTEMLVTAMLMVIVLFALYSIFDTGLRVFGFGNASTEATDNARLGLAKMEREIRAAYPSENASFPPGINRDPVLFTSFGSQQMTLGNDRNGDRMVDAGERITYELSGSGPPYTLLRNSQPVVEYVQNLNFTYLTNGGATTSTESAIRMVRIVLTIRVPRGVLGTQSPVNRTITTDVALRNRVE